MSSLKALKTRIDSIRSTRKITQAMRMVAAARLRRAQERAESSRPYALGMARMLADLASHRPDGVLSSPFLAGSGHDQNHLFVAIGTARGLCGSLNGQLARRLRYDIKTLEAKGKSVRLALIGRTLNDIMRREFEDRFMDVRQNLSAFEPEFAYAERLARILSHDFMSGHYNVCTLYFNHFQSVITQIPIAERLIPVAVDIEEEDVKKSSEQESISQGSDLHHAVTYSFEPSESRILAELLPRNIAIQIYHGMLEALASEQGARLTAMDSATRNAGKMIDRLTLQYNRTRQATITRELIEIISGAEAL